MISKATQSMLVTCCCILVVAGNFNFVWGEEINELEKTNLSPQKNDDLSFLNLIWDDNINQLDMTVPKERREKINSFFWDPSERKTETKLYLAPKKGWKTNSLTDFKQFELKYENLRPSNPSILEAELTLNQEGNTKAYKVLVEDFSNTIDEKKIQLDKRTFEVPGSEIRQIGIKYLLFREFSLIPYPAWWVAQEDFLAVFKKRASARINKTTALEVAFDPNVRLFSGDFLISCRLRVGFEEDTYRYSDLVECENLDRRIVYNLRENLFRVDLRDLFLKYSKQGKRKIFINEITVYLHNDYKELIKNSRFYYVRLNDNVRLESSLLDGYIFKNTGNKNTFKFDLREINNSLGNKENNINSLTLSFKAKNQNKDGGLRVLNARMIGYNYVLEGNKYAKKAEENRQAEEGKSLKIEYLLKIKLFFAEKEIFISILHLLILVGSVCWVYNKHLLFLRPTHDLKFQNIQAPFLALYRLTFLLLLSLFILVLFYPVFDPYEKLEKVPLYLRIPEVNLPSLYLAWSYPLIFLFGTLYHEIYYRTFRVNSFKKKFFSKLIGIMTLAIIGWSFYKYRVSLGNLILVSILLYLYLPWLFFNYRKSLIIRFLIFISGAILLYEIGKYFGKGNNLFLTLGISTCLIVWISFAREITYSYEKHPSNYGNAINDRLSYQFLVGAVLFFCATIFSKLIKLNHFADSFGTIGFSMLLSGIIVEIFIRRRSLSSKFSSNQS